VDFSTDYILQVEKMRITELLEGKVFDDMDFVKQSGDKKEINFDLIEDLIHFMHNDDNVYRRNVYPVIAQCLDRLKADKKTTPDMFEEAIKNSYKLYAKKFPIKELPDELDNNTCKKACGQIHEEFCQHVEEGLYKD
jgi:hypothetical protein